MANKQLTEGGSLLAVEVGSINTSASLLDTVAGQYRFLASGASPSTVAAPMLDASEGVRSAFDHLSSITKRSFLGEDEGLIIPASNGLGVDRFVATFSAGVPLRIAAAGLLEDVSLESIRRLVSSVNGEIVESISLSDERRTEAQIDSFLRVRPDVVVIAGGTNQGASRSVLKLINTLGMAINMLPASLRPEILYAGNEALAENAVSFLGELTSMTTVPNIRPSLEVENLGPAEERLAEIFRRIHGEKILGIQELDLWSKGSLLPTSAAFGRIIRFLSRVYGQDKGVLGIDVGASSTTVASSFSGNLSLNSFPHLGIGEGLTGLLQTSKLEDINRWVPFEVSDSYLANYLYNKTIYPSSLPATPQDLAIEQAFAREVMRTAINKAKEHFPSDSSGPFRAGLPWFEPIMVRGSVIVNAPSLTQSLLMILDGLEPTGITRIILDKNRLAPAMGAAAGVNSLLAVQVLESSAFFNLGTLISPVGKARSGTPILRLTIKYDSGQENSVDIKFGTIRAIPLPAGRTAQLRLQPLHRFDVGMGGAGKSGSIRVVGGYFGIVIDARGRPIRLSASPERRREGLIRWHRSLSK